MAASETLADPGHGRWRIVAAQELRDGWSAGDAHYGGLLAEGTAIIEEEVERLRTLVVEFSQFARMPAPQKAWVEIDELTAQLRVVERCPLATQVRRPYRDGARIALRVPGNRTEPAARPVEKQAARVARTPEQPES